MNGSRKMLHVVRWILRLTFLLSLGAWLAGWQLAKRLHDDIRPSPELQQDPVQIKKRVVPFDFAYMGTTYVIETLADYELWGLVVTHNDTRGIADAYHTSKSVDIRDLCVVWGSNANMRLLSQFSFWSNTWTCYIHTKSSGAFERFDPRRLSNNHLLSADADIRARILHTSVGDQIHLKGRLVDYYPKGRPELARETSLSRDDTGNGACEVVFVDSFEVLSRGNVLWRGLRDIGRLICLITLGAMLIVFLADAYSQ